MRMEYEPKTMYNTTIENSTRQADRPEREKIMNANEIKTAWNTFKKEVKKEVSFDMTGDCYMNKKQIENGTATICLCNDIEYDREIDRVMKRIAKVNDYDSWTAEEKKNSEIRDMEEVRKYETLKATYGTRSNEAVTKFAEITETKAFKKLTEIIGITRTEKELVKKWEGLSVYQIRIHY